LRSDFLERVETFSDRVLDVVDALPPRRVSVRILDQMSAAGTSVGANVFEADEAMSGKDFCKSLGVALKELSETRYWLRLVGRRGWVKRERLTGLEAEGQELRRILGTMVAKTSKRPRRAN
jgi:four helix bundle protein